MPKLYLAAYTTPLQEKTGYRWIWRHQNISDQLLGVLYNKIKKPTDVLRWSSNELHGGLTFVDSEWCAVFRFLNAGRDALGRQGRFFLTAGFLRSNELSQLDLLQALESPLFSTPLESPVQRMELDLPPVSTHCPDELLRNLREVSMVEVVGVENVNELAAAGAKLAGGSDFSLQVNGESMHMVCSVSVSSPAVEGRKTTSRLHPSSDHKSNLKFPVRNPRNMLPIWGILSVLVILCSTLLYVHFKPPSPQKPLGSSQTPEPQRQVAQQTVTVRGIGKSPAQAEADALTQIKSNVMNSADQASSIRMTYNKNNDYGSVENWNCVVVIEYEQK